MTKRRSDDYDDDWGFYPPSTPRRVEGGIRARSQRGAFTKSWWGGRWIAALQRLMDPGRLQRGRSYARQGQVLNIDLRAGHVSARVQGSRRTPYKVEIRLKPLADAEWGHVLDALAGQALFAAQLLNGEMPADVEEVFDAARVPLFPASRRDLDTSCSCPDSANPCKHIAAVYYLLGERFDEDPFLLFELRGRDKDQIAAGLRERRAREAEGADTASPAPEPEAPPPSALEDSLDRYWALGPEVDTMAFDLAAPEVEMPLLKRLGPPPLPGSDAPAFQAQMARVYHRVTDRARQIAFADPATGQNPPAG